MKRWLIPVLLGLASCTGASSSPPDPTTGTEPTDHSGPMVAAPTTHTDDGSIPGPTLPAGLACNSDSECDAEEVCEGIGCEPGQGRCTPRERMCTRDLATYCGCDGEEFQSSGSCPGKRFSHRGSCERGLALGEPCWNGAQCSTGLCSGAGLEGCHGGARGTCSDGSCTEDEARFCGCNGFEFHGSSTCPNQQFAHRGPCDG